MMTSALTELVARHRAIVCVGTGGVGKTTIAAALGLSAATLGKRAMVLTIDPAHQLARALGMAALGSVGDPVATEMVAPPGALFAAMLDQKAAWDAFITRHAPSREVRDTLLDNRFYQRLSTSLAGSTEYMAMEELCRLDESDAYDLIVIDTPPAGHAIDFLLAPERIEHLLDREVAGWLRRPIQGAGWSALSRAVQLVVRRLERAMGSRTLREISAFLVALDALFGDIAARAERVRALLRSESTAFVLVVAPTPRELEGAAELQRTMKRLEIPLRAVIANRVHPVGSGGEVATTGAIDRALGRASSDEVVRAWLAGLWRASVLRARTERDHLGTFRARLPSGTAWAELPELARDAHSLADLAALIGSR